MRKRPRHWASLLPRSKASLPDASPRPPHAHTNQYATLYRTARMQNHTNPGRHRHSAQDRLVALASALLTHVRSQPPRDPRHLGEAQSLIHYYGAYSIRLPAGPFRRCLGCQSGRPLVYYVVMRNHLHGLKGPHLTFDLKGATFNRRRVRQSKTRDALRRAIIEAEPPRW